MSGFETNLAAQAEAERIEAELIAEGMAPAMAREVAWRRVEEDFAAAAKTQADDWRAGADRRLDAYQTNAQALGAGFIQGMRDKASDYGYKPLAQEIEQGKSEIMSWAEASALSFLGSLGAASLFEGAFVKGIQEWLKTSVTPWLGPLSLFVVVVGIIDRLGLYTGSYTWLAEGYGNYLTGPVRDGRLDRERARNSRFYRRIERRLYEAFPGDELRVTDIADVLFFGLEDTHLAVRARAEHAYYAERDACGSIEGFFRGITFGAADSCEDVAEKAANKTVKDYLIFLDDLVIGALVSGASYIPLRDIRRWNAPPPTERAPVPVERVGSGGGGLVPLLVAAGAAYAMMQG